MFERLQQLLRDRRNQGETNEAIAKSADTSQQHINRLLNGSPEQFEKLKFGTVLKLFPGMIRLVEPNGQISQTNSPGAAAAIGGNASVQTKDEKEEYSRRVMDAIINDDSMCDKCRTIALRHIRAVANNKE